MREKSIIPRIRDKQILLRILAIFFLLLPLLIIPSTPLTPGRINDMQNLSKIAPGTGSSSGNPQEAMNQYMTWLNETAGPMMFFFTQITGLFGTGNPNLLGNTSGDLQSSLQQVFTLVNGSALYP